jgi:phosphorylcholine metabolism protein LicD
MKVADLCSLMPLEEPKHARRPGDENTLKIEKEALKEIVRLLKENNIPFWADCGTCLGAYRYGGIIPWDFDIDIAVLQPDFDNVKRALNGLDKKKYAVQDWSGRTRPKSYLKVYVKETGALIDIYHFRIDPSQQNIISIFSNEESIFMSESWKTRERRYLAPTPFDVVFPLKLAQFDDFELPIPNQTKLYLQARYGENIGPAKIYNEKTGQYEKDLNHPYWQRAFEKG